MTKELEVPRELLDKYRDVNVDHNWWDYTYEEHSSNLLQIGFDTTDMRFSGFWCQGDGASFTGRVFDWDLFLAELDPRGEEFPMLRKVECKSFELVRLHGSSYSHENTVGVGVHDADEWDEDTDCEATNAIRAAWNRKLRQELDTFESDALGFLRGKMRELYRDLEEEYNYLTSDELIAEYVREHAPEELEEYWASDEAA